MQPAVVAKVMHLLLNFFADLGNIHNCPVGHDQ